VSLSPGDHNSGSHSPVMKAPSLSPVPNTDVYLSPEYVELVNMLEARVFYELGKYWEMSTCFDVP